MLTVAQLVKKKKESSVFYTTREFIACPQHPATGS
jgi:hypothetical protein